MDVSKSDLKRYGVVFFGLIMAAGFTFGGMASMSSLIQTPTSPDNGDEMDAELPDSHYSSTGYNLSDNEKMYLAVTESKVFITGYYDSGNESQKQLLTGLKQLNEIFGNVTYVELTDSDSGRLLNSAGISDYPAIIVNGGVTRQGSPRIQTFENVTSIDTNQLTESICQVIIEYPNDATLNTCV
ncbi:MAG: hypothetical protein ACI977_000100 [Candidatus Nanohaloarchaea archaeon]|jgi:hypothetical protein